MADQPAGPAAPFPTPPPFYQHFTKQNVARLRQIRREAGIPTTTGEDETHKPDIDVTSLPTELRYLIPPEPPSDDKFTAFGQELNLNPPEATLADSGIEQLYPSHPSVRLNPQPHLIALARSMLTSFLSLTGILSQNPELFEEKAQDLQTIAFNMHDLINQYRPHQARETLILMMEERLAEMKDEIRRVDEAKDKVGKLLQDLQSNGTTQEMQEKKSREGPVRELEDKQAEIRKQRQRRAWGALEAELG